MHHHSYPGSVSSAVTDREARNRSLARKAAAEGIVLLKNQDNALPLQKNARIALFGAGVQFTVKGGTGSGDVNERDVVSVYDGIQAAGFTIANEQWLADYRVRYEAAWDAWRESILSHASTENPRALLDAYLNTPFILPAARAVTEAELAGFQTQTAVYVIRRQAGEGKDRTLTPGDYYLSENEKNEIQWISETFQRFILVINCGGPVDLGFLDTMQASAVLYMCQAGMEGGNALADILSGAVSPSGKLTDTWAKRYADYPSADTYNQDEAGTELYTDGIYVGYRYFDTFQVEPRYPFGYGLSYTSFSLEPERFSIQTGDSGMPCVTLSVRVTNTGGQYSGREVVQAYAACPQGALAKEYQRLCAFAKTPLLAPGEQCAVSLAFPLEQLASFSPEAHCLMVEQGDYAIAVGNSSRHTVPAQILRLTDTVCLQKLASICPLQKPLPEISFNCQVAAYPEVPVTVLNTGALETAAISYAAETLPEVITKTVDALSVEQLTLLVNGDISKRNQGASATIGSSGVSVPGAAGETSACAAQEPWSIPGVVFADGPAGLRLAKSYQVLPNGEIFRVGFGDTLERGIFATPRIPGEGETTYYQFCTAFPVGTLLAQTWDTDMLEQVGIAVAGEMREFHVTLWLAPGMNIHRNPLCGRNFEYFSEDPLLSGKLAAALTRGVQRTAGTGTTIKHFACNQRENKRKQSDSVVSERALREIYLRGFEIAVKETQPMALMSSYNCVNGVHTANSYDLITKVLRQEWGFQGLVMTDWTTTGVGGSSPIACMHAGNDLIMPGSPEDISLLRQAMDTDETLLADTRQCVGRLVRMLRNL